MRISFEGSCSPPHRAAEKAAAAGPSDEEEEDDPPAPSDVENPSGDDDDEPKPKPKPKKKGKGKGKGGIIVPEEWPWEDAKKVFEKPDVTPADDIEVRLNLLSDLQLSKYFSKLEWTNPDVDGLIQFLVTEKGFKCVILQHI